MHVLGIANQVRRERMLHVIKECQSKKNQESTSTLPFPLEESEVLPPTAPEAHHHMSKDVRNKLVIPRWLSEHENDQCLKVCLRIFSI